MTNPYVFTIITLAFNLLCVGGTCNVICPFDPTTNTTDCSSMGLTCFPEFDVQTRILILDDNLIQQFPEDAFESLTNLRTLHVKRNLLESVRERIFARVNQLSELNMNGNYITDVSMSAFEGLSELSLLDLSNNRLHSLPDMKDLVSLETLLLENNDFLLTPEFILPKLKTLSLRYNSIKHVISDSFKGTPSLVNLDIGMNLLSAFIAQDVVSTSLLNLKNVDVSHNVLTSCHFDTTSTLDILDLSYNHLSGLVVKAKSVRTIILESNFIRNLEDISLITEVDESRDGHVEVELTEILLDYNRVEFIKLSSFQNIKVEVDVISLNHNRINHISPYSFSQLNRIQGIFLNHNNLQEIEHGTFSDLSHIKTIDVSGNFISTLEIGSFSNLPELTKVFIGGNQHSRWLSNFSITLNDSSFISAVDISGNNINEIPFEFFYVFGKTLLHLILTENRLQSLKTEYFSNANVIEVLDLRRNSIETIDQDFFQTLITLKEINLHGNPILCDCRLEPYRAWLEMTNLEDVVICNGPPKLEGFRVIDLSKTQLICTLPNILLNDTIIYVAEGQDVVLICETNGIPQPTVSWMFPNHSSITNSHRHIIQSDSSLKITNIVKEDDGVYSCIASNFVGIVKETIKIYTIHTRELAGEGVKKTVGLAIGIAVFVQTLFACVVVYYWTSRPVQPRKTNNKLLAKAYPIERIHLHSTKSNTTIAEKNLDLRKPKQDYQEIQGILLTGDLPIESANNEIGQDNSTSSNNKPPFVEKHSQAVNKPCQNTSNLERAPFNLENSEKKKMQNSESIRSSIDIKERSTELSPTKITRTPKSSNQREIEEIVGAKYNSSYEQDTAETYF